MSLFYVNGLTVATAATDAHAILGIWNPHATCRLTLWEIGLVAVAAPAAGAGWVIRRGTTRGTAGSTVTPTLEHSRQRDSAPASGFLVDLAAYSAQPTLVAGELDCWVHAAVIGSGIIVPIPRGIEIPPATGLFLVNRAAIAFAAHEINVVVED